MSQRRGVDLHEQAAELLGAYALNAVEPDERVLVERHLDQCPKCRAELTDHVWVATTLGNSGRDAPEGVWDRIVGELEEAPPRLRLELPTGGLARVIPMATREPAPSRRLLVIGSVAAAGALIAGLGFQVVRQDSRIDEMNAALQDDAVQAAANVARLDPDSQELQLASSDGSVSASAVLRPSGSGYLIAAGLPALDKARTYQLWGQTENGLISLGLLGSSPDDVVAFEAGDGVTGLAITDEVAGGVHQSQNAPVLIGRFD